jgi:hypothetical protein
MHKLVHSKGLNNERNFPPPLRPKRDSACWLILLSVAIEFLAFTNPTGLYYF